MINRDAVLNALEVLKQAILGEEPPKGLPTADERPQNGSFEEPENVSRRLGEVLGRLGWPRLVPRIALREWFGQQGIPLEAWAEWGYVQIKSPTRPSDGLWSISNDRHHGTMVLIKIDSEAPAGRSLQQEIKDSLTEVAQRLNDGRL